VPQIVDMVKPIPVAAAGGIADGRGLVASLALGAVGVWCGTIFLATPDSLSVGSEVRLQFYLPNSSKEIKILGKVVYTITREEGKQNGQVPGMGIVFTDFSPSNRREISDYIEGLLAEKDIIIEKRRQYPRFDARIKVGFKSVNGTCYFTSTKRK